MKCEWVQENILLHIYNELPDDARYELEQHVARCAECAAELKAARQLHGALSQFPVHEPSPNLVTASRMRLQEALESTEQGGFWQRLVFDPGAWLRPIKLAPALAAAIFIVGFAGGIGATYQIMNGRNPVDLSSAAASAAGTAPTESSITGIQSISQQPGSSQISIRYNTTSTQEAQGSLNDQRIQQLLLFATRNNYNSGVRMDSVDLLTQTPNDTRVREALLYALRYDSNPGVRLKAIEGLGSYVKDDVRVRNAVLEALVNDSNPGLRTQALHLLEPVRADSSVRVVLQKLAENDQNLYIRTQSRNMLSQMSEID
jgi:HEAT repeats/Putative zinc-finger